MFKDFLKNIIRYEININTETFIEYFKYQNLSFVAKDLYSVSKNINKQIVNQVNDYLIDFRNAVNNRKTPENENPNKVIDIIEKILDFNKQQEGRRLEILRSKQMLQRLPIALAQVKAGNTFEPLLNEIRQIIYSLYQAKEITKKIYNNIMNPINA